MSCLQARTGRTRQRYKDTFRLVAGCIPYKIERARSQDKLLVLMVSSPNRDDLVFPKGGWENDEDVGEAACREALEEAGVRGNLSDNPLGVWEFRSKSRQNSCSQEGSCRGYIFALEVTEELESWPEMANKDRKWLSINEAFRLCRYAWMQEALHNFFITILGNGTMDIEDMSDCYMASTSMVDMPSSVQQIEESSKDCVVQA